METALLDVVAAVGHDIRNARRKLAELPSDERRKVLRTIASLLGLPADALLGIAPEDRL